MGSAPIWPPVNLSYLESRCEKNPCNHFQFCPSPYLWKAQKFPTAHARMLTKLPAFFVFKDAAVIMGEPRSFQYANNDNLAGGRSYPSRSSLARLARQNPAASSSVFSERRARPALRVEQKQQQQQPPPPSPWALAGVKMPLCLAATEQHSPGGDC